MKIKRIEVQGFKSFYNRAAFDFPEGITAVVGPNGCGKSNVVDAIRWAMGEQRPKHLRGKAMEDIIFKGANAHKPLGMAEVSLIFSNKAGLGPAQYADFSEISVSRRLFRSGESEYYINRIPCRLRDIMELFMDTGTGVRAYSIIEQGRIEALLNLTPIDRRELLEEAAGIAKYKARKKIALRKMESTQMNLIRVKDIIGEVRRQINSLKRQAKRAERFRAYQEEIRSLDLGLSALRFNCLISRRSELQEKIRQLRDSEMECQVSTEQTQNKAEEIRLAMVDGEKQLQQYKDELYESGKRTMLLEGRIALLKEETEELERRNERSRQEVERHRARLVGLEEERKRLIEKESGLRKIIKGTIHQLAEAEVLWRNIRAEQRELSSQLEGEKQLLVELDSRINRTRSQIEHIAIRESELLERKNILGKEIGRIRAESDERRRQIEIKEKEMLKLDEDRKKLEEKLAREMKLLDSGQKTVRNKNVELQNLKESLNAGITRLESLREIHNNYEGYQRGVRSIMCRIQDTHWNRNGIYGVLADVLEADPEFEAAVEAALGEKIQYILVQGVSEGIEAIDFLKSGSGGRGSFLPLSKYASSGNIVSEDQRNIDSSGGLLLKHVRAKKEYSGIVKSLLDSVYIVTDLREGLAQWKLNGGNKTYVTADGELIDRTGVITGGSKDTSGPGVLKRNREIRELEDKIAAIEASYGQSQEELDSALSHAESLEESVNALESILHQNQINRIKVEKDLAEFRTIVDRLEEQMEAMAFERGQIIEDCSAIVLAKNTSRKEHQILIRQRMEKEHLLWSLERCVSEFQRKNELIEGEVLAFKLTLTSAKEKLNNLIEEKKRIDEAEAQTAQFISDRESEIVEGDERTRNIQETILQSRQEIDERYKEKELLERKYEGVRASISRMKENLSKMDGQLREFRRKVEEVRNFIREHELKSSQIDLELDQIKKHKLEHYGLDIIGYAGSFDADKFDEAQARSRLIEVRELKGRLGEVNPMAIEEFEQLNQRYEFLTAQEQDLTKSLDSLQKVIQKINRTSKQRFIETFGAVNKKFKEIFPRLFNGGHAELVLTKPDDQLESGIEIIARPPGKKLQSVSLLSGGEKALVAISLIFSLMIYKPSPFCLLDEVDAPLDDANINRFIEIVREMALETQFILITHNKQTMEIADTLYGVTMSDPGVSKLVSVQLNN